MFKIGDFSKLAKISVKTLRFYDEIGLFKANFVDSNGYRYYSIEDLNKLMFITTLRRIDLPIDDIKKVLGGYDLDAVLTQRSQNIRDEIKRNEHNLLLIDKMLKAKGAFMEKYKAVEKVLPETVVYFRHGVIKTMANLTEFILEAGAECQKFNPDLKCTNYCFVTYEANEYQEENIELEYLEAVEKIGVESENIKFKVLPSVKAICVEHKGSYSKLGDAYAYAVNWVKEKNFEICEKIREVYIHGCWDCESEDNYLSEIQIPIKC